jgi:DNA relaxase NicK
LRTVFGWDWTQTTHHHGPGAVADLVKALGAVTTMPGPGRQGWTDSVQAYDAEGYLLGKVFFGGERGDVHVEATSAAADLARPAVVGLYGAKTARVDTRVDTLVPFEDLAAILEDAAAGYGSQIIRVESEVRGRSTGRTVYLGSPKSAIRVRLYEKWLESPGEYVEGTNRVEVQLRPASRVKREVSAWSPMETFCASRVTRRIADQLADDLVPKSTLHVNRGTPDLERSLEAMGEQYGGAVDRFLQWSGGDVDRVLAHLLRQRNVREFEARDMVDEQAERIVADVLGGLVVED